MNRHEPMLAEADVRETPPELFAALDSEFHFTLDACATHSNTKVRAHYCTEKGRFGWLECCLAPDLGCEPHLLGTEDGLASNWRGERVWVNPPYSDIESWVGKAWDSDAELVVMLIPSTRTEQGWWQDLVEPFRDGNGDDVAFPAGDWTTFRVRFLRGRPRFLKDGVRMGSPKFGCCLLVWTRQ